MNLQETHKFTRETKLKSLYVFCFFFPTNEGNTPTLRNVGQMLLFLDYACSGRFYETLLFSRILAIEKEREVGDKYK